MKKGIVKEYIIDEGFGWIAVEGDNDYWVHFTGIDPDPVRFPPVPPATVGFRFLESGQSVMFEIAGNLTGDNGAKVAINVVILD